MHSHLMWSGPDLMGTQGAQASQQTVHILFLGNDRGLRDYDLLIIVLVRPNFYAALCLATVQFSSPFTLTAAATQ